MNAKLARIKSPVYLPPLTFAALSLLILGASITSTGYFFALDWTFPPTLNVANDLYGLRGYEEYIYAELPFQLLLSGLNLIAPSWLLQKLVIFLIFFLTGLSAYRLTARISREAGYFSGILYTINPFTYVRFLSGQWANLLGYALIPSALLSFMHLLEKGGRRSVVSYAIWLSLITVFSLHMTLLASFACLLLFLTHNLSHRNLPTLKQSLKHLTLAALLYTAINTYWLIPLLTAKDTVITNFTTEDAYIFSAKPIVQNIYFTIASMHGFWREGYQYTFNTIEGWHYIALIFIILAAIGLYHGSKIGGEQEKAYIKGIAICMITSAVFATGTSGIFKPLNLLLYENLPLYRAFRDSHKFVALITLGYAHLGGIGVAAITKHLKDSKLKKLHPIILAALLALPLIYQFNMLLSFNGQLKTYDYPQPWYEANKFLNSDKDDFNTLFLPWHNYMYFSWAGSNIANPAKLFFNKPTIQAQNIEVGPVYTRSTNPAQRYIDFLLSKTQQINNFGELISPLNVKYILLAKEADYERYNFLYSQTDLKPIFENEAFTIFINEKYVGRIYQPEHLIVVNGYEDILQASKTIDISRSAIITSNTNLQIPEAPFKKINYTTENPITYNIKEEHTVIAFTPPNLNSDGWVLDGTKSLETLGFQAVYTNKDGRTITYERFNTYLTAYTTSATAALAATYLALREKANQASQKAKAPQTN